MKDKSTVATPVSGIYVWNGQHLRSNILSLSLGETLLFMPSADSIRRNHNHWVVTNGSGTQTIQNVDLVIDAIGVMIHELN